MMKRKARHTYRHGQLGSGGEMGGLLSVMAMALTVYRREDAKLVPGRAVIKMVRGQTTRRHEGGRLDEPN